MLAERLMALRRALFAAHLRCNLVADGRLVHCHGRRADGLLIHVSLQPIATLIVHLRSMLQHTYTGNTCVRETDKNESSSGPRNRVRPVFDLVCSACTCYRPAGAHASCVLSLPPRRSVRRQPAITTTRYLKAPKQRHRLSLGSGSRRNTQTRTADPRPTALTHPAAAASHRTSSQSFHRLGSIV